MGTDRTHSHLPYSSNAYTVAVLTTSMSASLIKPAMLQKLSQKSAFATGTPCRLGAPKFRSVGRVSVQPVQMSRVCDLTGKKRNNAMVVTFSHKRIRKIQNVNLQEQKFYWEREKRWVKLKVSTKAMRSISKLGLEEMAKRANLDLYKLPYQDVSEAR